MFNRFSIYITWLFYGLVILVNIYLLPKMLGCTGLYELCWSRWDSGLYLDIARNGISLVPCEANASQWCGNAGWAPLYGYLTRWVSSLFQLKETIAAGILSATFTWASVFVALRFKKQEGNKYWYVYGLFYLCGLGSIYMYAIFPISLIVLLITLILVNLKRKKWTIAALVTSVAALSYSTGFLLIPIYCLYLLLHGGLVMLKKEEFWKNFLIASIGFFALLILHYSTTGHFDAMFLTQAKYGHGLQNPLKILGQRLGLVVENFGTLKMTIELQNIYMFFFSIVVTVYGILKPKKQHLFIAACFIMLFILPFSLGVNLSLYRSVALLIPIILLFTKKQEWLVKVHLIISLLLFLPMAQLFILSILV